MAYLFLGTLLPPLVLYQKPEMARDELQFHLERNLSKQDLEKAAFIEDLYSLENRGNFWLRLIKSRKEAMGILQSYVDFEYKLAITLGALRAGTLEKEVIGVLRTEAIDPPLLHEISAAPEFQKIRGLYEAQQARPLACYRAILGFKMSYFEEKAVFSPFSIEAILSYLVRFFLVERSLELDETQGKRRLDHLLGVTL